MLSRLQRSLLLFFLAMIMFVDVGFTSGLDSHSSQMGLLGKLPLWAIYCIDIYIFVFTKTHRLFSEARSFMTCAKGLYKGTNWSNIFPQLFNIRYLWLFPQIFFNHSLNYTWFPPLPKGAKNPTLNVQHVALWNSSGGFISQAQPFARLKRMGSPLYCVGHTIDACSFLWPFGDCFHK